METVNLPPELEQFAAEAVAAGRYGDVSEVVAAGLHLLRRSEAEVADFVRTLEEAQAQAEREGCRGAENVHRDMVAMLDRVAHDRA